MIEIQEALIASRASHLDCEQIAQTFRIATMHSSDEETKAIEALIQPGVTAESFMDGVNAIEVAHDEANATSTAIVGNEGMWLPGEKS